jgi:hypothetical protein
MKLHDLVRAVEPGQPTPPELASLLGREKKDV